MIVEKFFISWTIWVGLDCIGWADAVTGKSWPFGGFASHFLGFPGLPGSVLL